ncbi:MAG: hypothetical protein AAF502_24925 [Bacteroidota bacterium]
MYPRNGFYEDGHEKDHLSFKKRGKKLNNYQKQKPKHKNAFWNGYEEDVDDILKDGMNLDLKSILREEGDF